MQLVLFDDDCLVCNRAIQFILKYDHGQFHFAALNSELGKKLVEQFQLHHIDSVILVENNQAYTHSSAALRIAKGFKFPWRLVALLYIVPRPIRDIGYKWIAANRKKLPMKQQCILLTSEQRQRFIQ